MDIFWTTSGLEKITSGGHNITRDTLFASIRNILKRKKNKILHIFKLLPVDDGRDGNKNHIAFSNLRVIIYHP